MQTQQHVTSTDMRKTLEAKAQAGKSERVLRPLRLGMWLTQLEEDGIVQPGWYRSNGRWYITAQGFRGERAYTTDEAEAFVHGCDAARNR